MKIVLIEDQNLLSSTLIKSLDQEPDLEIAGQSDKARDVLQLCAKHQPDLVIMDVFTKDGNGIDYTRQLKQVFPMIKVLIMTGVEDDRLVQAAEEVQADFFVWKNSTLEELIEFIRNAKKPYRIYPSVERISSESIRFSEVEIRILHLLSRGKTTREIAAELFLGYGTVRLYISRMYTATGFKSRAQLVAYALRCGLIDSNGTEAD